MLRVRPVLFTSKLEEYSALLVALGMECVVDHSDWRLFDSGDGKVGLCRASAGSIGDGTTELGFEIRDREGFVRRTLADGTRAELVDDGRGPGARVTAPDGFSFPADPVADSAALVPGPLTVVQLWRTPDPDAARKVLADIGARPVPPRPDGRTPFRARNGGLVAVHPGPDAGVVLAFEYDGDTAALGARLADAGLASEAVGGALSVAAPDGGAIRVLPAAGP